jgi:predicted RNase H-like nuclease (RuvC/YqgF family)
MKLPKPPNNPELDLSQEIEEVERSLQELQERYFQVQQDREQKAQLQQRLQSLAQNVPETWEIKSEIRRIKQQIGLLEVNLESQLFSWSSLKRPFWQIVRFSGLGVVIGWLLKSYVDK